MRVNSGSATLYINFRIYSHPRGTRMRKNDMPEDNQEKIRTSQQQKSLEVYCKQLSSALVEAGISQRMFLEGLEHDTSPEFIKAVFRAIGKSKYGKISTADLTTKECSDVYEELNRQSASKGVSIPWPSENELANQQLL